MFTFAKVPAAAENSAQNVVTSSNGVSDSATSLFSPSSGTDLDLIQDTPSEITVKRPNIKFVETIPMEKSVLNPGETASVEMWICAPTQFGDSGSTVTGVNLSRE